MQSRPGDRLSDAPVHARTVDTVVAWMKKFAATVNPYWSQT